MNRHAFINILAAASCLLSLLVASDSGLVRLSVASGETALPSDRKTEHHYTLNAGVRLLLFWVGRDNVGGGRIAWTKESGSTEALELLIGSDPDRAPRRINRWGYIKEQVSGHSAELTGIMTQSDEQSIEQADANSKSEGKYAFKAIRGQVTGHDAQSSTLRMNLPENYSYKDIPAVLKQIPKAGPFTRNTAVPDGVDPGFLVSMKSIIHESIEQYRNSGGKVRNPKARRYIYNGALYQLSVNSSSFLGNMTVNGRQYQGLIESKFEARNTVTGKISKFSITYGTGGSVQEVPVRILYQPRFWFRAELLLDDSAGIAQTAKESR